MDLRGFLFVFRSKNMNNGLSCFFLCNLTL